jgi:hypothetical protein
MVIGVCVIYTIWILNKVSVVMALVDQSEKQKEKKGNQEKRYISYSIDCLERLEGRRERENGRNQRGRTE